LQHGDLYSFSFFGKYNLLHLEHFPSKGIVSIVISEESNQAPKTAALKVLINKNKYINFKKLRETFDWSISIKKSVIIKVDIDPENEICEKNALLEKIIGC